MIEWIDNTVTLKDFICESFSGGKESGMKQLLVQYIIKQFLKTIYYNFNNYLLQTFQSCRT